MRELVFGVGRVLVVLLLALREEHLVGRDGLARLEWFGRRYRPRPAIARNLTTLFGVVRYWHRYMRDGKGGRGFHPLDMSLGLGADRLSSAWQMVGDGSYGPDVLGDVRVEDGVHEPFVRGSEQRRCMTRTAPLCGSLRPPRARCGASAGRWRPAGGPARTCTAQPESPTLAGRWE